MKDKRKLRQTVFHLLCNNRATRNSDKVLYVEVVKKLTPSLGNMPLVEVFTNKELPNYESVGRARRWVQAHFSYLKADDEVKEARKAEEEDWKDYSQDKGKVVFQNE